MGLESAEILMDIEDEFCIEISSDTRLEGYIYELEDLVKRLYSADRIKYLMHLVPEDETDGYIDHYKYEQLWNKHKSLPAPKRMIFLRNKHSKKDIILTLENKLRYMDSNLITEKIHSIIIERTCFKGILKSQYHLIRDLGCG